MVHLECVGRILWDVLSHVNIFYLLLSSWTAQAIGAQRTMADCDRVRLLHCEIWFLHFSVSARAIDMLIVFILSIRIMIRFRFVSTHWYFTVSNNITSVSQMSWGLLNIFAIIKTQRKQASLELAFFHALDIIWKQSVSNTHMPTNF